MSLIPWLSRTHSQHLWMLFWSMFTIFYAYIDILVATLWQRSIQHFWAAQPPLFIEVFLSLTTWHFQKSGRLFKWRVVTTWSDRHDPSRYLKLPQAVRLPAVNLTSFLNFTTRHPASRAVNSNWRPDSVHVYWTCVVVVVRHDGSHSE